MRRASDVRDDSEMPPACCASAMRTSMRLSSLSTSLRSWGTDCSSADPKATSRTG